MAASQRQILASLLLQAQGYSAEGAAAIVGNISQESGKNLPSAFRTSHLDHGSNGLPQWRLERLTDYEAYVRKLHPGKTDAQYWALYGEMAYQIAYMAIEFRRDYAALDAKLRAHGDVAVLTQNVCWDYERPNRAQSGIANRVAQAQETYADAPRTKSPADALAKVNAISGSHATSAKSTGFVGALAAGGTVVATAHAHTGGNHWFMFAMLGFGVVITGLVLFAASLEAKASTSTSGSLAATKAIAITP